MDDPLLQVAPGEKLRAELGKRGDPVEHETDAPLQTAKWDRLWDEHDPAVGPAISAELSVETPKVNLVLRDENPSLARRIDELGLIVLAHRLRLGDGQDVQPSRSQCERQAAIDALIEIDGRNGHRLSAS